MLYLLIMDTQQKIYLQDEKMLIGSKVWEFVGQDSNPNMGLRKKTIPVSAISGVDFVYYPKIYVILLILGILCLLVGWIWGLVYGDIIPAFWEFLDEPDTLIFFIGLILTPIGVILTKLLKGKGKIQVITNNILSSYSYRNIRDTEASKYVDAMRKCLLEKESLEK